MGFSKPQKEIARVKVLGVTQAIETKSFVAHNYNIYSLLVEYIDDTRALVECEFSDMQKYVPYIDID